VRVTQGLSIGHGVVLEEAMIRNKREKNVKRIVPGSNVLNPG